MRRTWNRAHRAGGGLLLLLALLMSAATGRAAEPAAPPVASGSAAADANASATNANSSTAAEPVSSAQSAESVSSAQSAASASSAVSGESKPVDPQAFLHYGQGRRYQREGRLDEAIVEYGKAAELDPGSAQILRDLAAVHRANGDRDQAMATYKKILALSPKDSESLYSLGLLTMINDRPAALAYFNEVLAAVADPKADHFYGLALYLGAELLDRQGQPQAAADRFAKFLKWQLETPAAVQRTPELERLQAARQAVALKAIQLYLKLKQPVPAVALLKETSADLLKEKGFLPLVVMPLLEMKEYALALELTKTSLESRPDDAALYRLLARIYEAQGDNEAFVKAFRELSLKQADVPAIKLILAEKLLETDQEAEGLKLMEALLVEPNLPEELGGDKLLRRVTELLVRNKKPAAALKLALAAQQRTPAAEDIYLLIGRLYDESGDREGFVKTFRQFHQDQPQMNVVALMLGRKLLEAGQTDEGLKLIEPLLAEKSQYAGLTREALVDYYKKTNHPELALKVFADAMARGFGSKEAIFMQTLPEGVPSIEEAPTTLEVCKVLLELAKRPELFNAEQTLADSGRLYVDLCEFMDSLENRPAVLAAAQALFEKSYDKPLAAAAAGDDIVVDAGDSDGPAAAEKTGKPAAEKPAGPAKSDSAAPADAQAEKKSKTGLVGVAPNFVLGLLAESFDLPAAARYYEAVIEADPKFPPAYERRAAVLLADGRFNDCETMLREAIETGYRFRIFFRQLAAAYALLDRDADAAQTYLSAAKVFPGYRGATYDLAELYVRLGQPDRGRQVLEELVKDNPNAVRAALRLASFVADRGDVDGGLKVLDKFLADHPDQASDLLYVRGALLLEKKSYDEALRISDQLAAEEGGEKLGLHLRATALTAMKKFDEAEALRRRLIEMEPESPDYQYQMVILRHEANQEAQAEQLLAEILKKHPSYAGASNDLGYTRADRGEALAESERMIRVALLESPDSPAYLDSLGWVLYKQNKIEPAVRCLRQSLRLDPAIDPVVWEHLGDALVRAGNMKEAQAAYEQATAVLRDPKRTASRTDAEVGGRLKVKLAAIAKGGPVTVAPLGNGIK